MISKKNLEKQFEDSRSSLFSVALRLLGSSSEAGDAMQEAWMKINAYDGDAIENVNGWLRTVVSRICFDMLRKRKRTSDEVTYDSELVSNRNPEDDIVLADTVEAALVVVLNKLTPAERVSFVLHEIFDLPFSEIGKILNHSPASARQLASRARKRVQDPATQEVKASNNEKLVRSFLSASRDGDLEGLLYVLSPEIVLKADELAVTTAAANAKNGAPQLSSEIRGASKVTTVFKGRAQGAKLATINGNPGAAWIVDGKVKSAFIFLIENGEIIEIQLVMNTDELGKLSVSYEK